MYRYYGSAAGRYTRRDPLGLYPSLNVYAYVDGRPYYYYDPYGLWSMDWLWKPIYDATGWVPSDDQVNTIAGIGNGMSFGIAVIANHVLGQDVDYCSAAYTTGNLVGSLIGGGAAIGRSAATGIFRHSASGKRWGDLSSAWKNVSPRIRNVQNIPSNYQLHHWLISRNGPIGRRIPDWIKNHPWNLNPIAFSVHQGVHGYGPTPYNFIGRWWFGTPGWAKALQSYFLGGAPAK